MDNAQRLAAIRRERVLRRDPSLREAKRANTMSQRKVSKQAPFMGANSHMGQDEVSGEYDPLAHLMQRRWYHLWGRH